MPASAFHGARVAYLPDAPARAVVRRLRCRGLWTGGDCRLGGIGGALDKLPHRGERPARQLYPPIFRRGEDQGALAFGAASTATALALREAGLPFRLVFADTGWEAPETYAHLDELEKHLGVIARVGRVGGFPGLIRERAGFPARKQRFCTEELKIRPIAAYHAAQEQDTVAVLGVRAEESEARALLPAWEDNETLDTYVWRPILDWTTADVIAIHHRHGVPLWLPRTRQNTGRSRVLR